MAVDELLLAPRWRHLCLATAQHLSPAVVSAWWQLARHQGDPARTADLVDALGAIDPAAVLAWTDPQDFVLPMAATISAAMGWQPPHDEDFVAAFPAIVDALRPLVAAISASPATSWWTSPADLDSLRCTFRYDESFPPVEPEFVGAAGRLAVWRETEVSGDERDRRERPADVTAPHSGHWWSTPAPAGLPTTTRKLSFAGSVNLLWEEDSFGQQDALVRPVRTTRLPRVYEIDGAEAWIELVRRYPLELTWSRRHDWYRVTGEDAAWRIPDWTAVSRDWDGVHLTVFGYLSTATRLLRLDDRIATLLAGWDPDQTWWLRDVLAAETDRPEHWRMQDADITAWERVE